MILRSRQINTEFVKCVFREGHIDGNSNIRSIRDKVISIISEATYMDIILIITLAIIEI